MSNKKLNIKSERLSRSLWLSDEFYVENSSEKIVGKVYKNAAKISDYMNTGGGAPYPQFMSAYTSECFGLSTVNGDWINFIPYSSWTYYSVSPESGKLFFPVANTNTYSYLYTEDNRSLTPASHVGETIVIVANRHEGSSDDNRALYGEPIAAAPFKIVDYNQFKEYLAKPEPSATKYFEIETMLSEMSDYESYGDGYTLGECYFYILDESYPELCSASISSSPEERIDGLVHLFSVYRAVTETKEFINNSTLRFSVFPVSSYNGAYANEAAYEINSSAAMTIDSIVDDPTQPDGWYWDGIGWKAWYDGDSLKKSATSSGLVADTDSVISNLALGSVSGIFSLYGLFDDPSIFGDATWTYSNTNTYVSSRVILTKMPENVDAYYVLWRYGSIGLSYNAELYNLGVFSSVLTKGSYIKAANATGSLCNASYPLHIYLYWTEENCLEIEMYRYSDTSLEGLLVSDTLDNLIFSAANDQLTSGIFVPLETFTKKNENVL